MEQVTSAVTISSLPGVEVTLTNEALDGPGNIWRVEMRITNSSDIDLQLLGVDARGSVKDEHVRRGSAVFRIKATLDRELQLFSDGASDITLSGPRERIKQVADLIKQHVDEVLISDGTRGSGITYRLAVAALRPGIYREMRRNLDDRLAGMRYTVSSASAARVLFDELVARNALDFRERMLLEGRLEKIEELDSELRRISEWPIVIHPRSKFEEDFEVRLGKALIYPRLETMGFTVKMRTSPDNLRTDAVSASLYVSPNEFILSFIAGSFGALGDIARQIIAASRDNAQLAVSNADLFSPFVSFLFAFVLFAASGSVPFIKAFAASVSWRTAALAGLVVGLAQDQVVESITGLLRG